MSRQSRGDALSGAALIYRHLAEGRYLIFDKPLYKFLKPSAEDMREKAKILEKIAREENW